MQKSLIILIIIAFFGTGTAETLNNQEKAKAIDEVVALYKAGRELEAADLLKALIRLEKASLEEDGVRIGQDFEDNNYSKVWNHILRAVQFERSKESLRKACDNGDVQTCLDLAIILDYEGKFTESGNYYFKAETLFLKAVSINGNNIYYIKNLTYIYGHKKWLGRNQEKKKYWYKQLLEAKMLLSKASVERLCMNGDFYPPCISQTIGLEAKGYYSVAETVYLRYAFEFKNPWAIKRLILLYGNESWSGNDSEKSEYWKVKLEEMEVLSNDMEN